MDGYSVEEAAEVLGIPQGRVWELIARGVLAGATEGGASMRVFLKPAAGQATPDAGDSGNGNGDRRRINGEPHGEMSPFRELLTEFRSLTERYGQALLALGEARGEVAALRSRVDTLEARIEMRLPYRPSSTVAWEMPDRGTQPPPQHPGEQPPTEAGVEAPSQPGVAPQPFADVSAEQSAADAATQPVTQPTAQPAAGDDSPMAAAEAPRRRSSGSVRGVAAGLADALARAEDPTLADLPGADEAARALAALQRDLEAARRDAEATPRTPAPDAGHARREPEPDVPPPVEAAFAPVIDQAEEPAPPALEAEAPGAHADEPGATYAPAAGSPYTTDVVEPDWFADGDFAWLEPESSPEGTEAPPFEEHEVDAASEPEPSTEATEPEPFAEHAVAVASEPEPSPEPVAEVEGAPVAEVAPPEPEPSPEPVAEVVGAPVAELAPREPVAEVEPTPEPEAAEGAGLVADFPSEEDLVAASTFEEPQAPPDPTAELPGHERAAEELSAEADDLSPAPLPDSTEGVSDVAPAPASETAQPSPGPGISRFGLYRGQLESAPPRPRASAPVDREEEARMWLGDEVEAAGIEVTGPGWRAGEGVAAPPEAGPEVAANAGPDATQGPEPPVRQEAEPTSPPDRLEETTPEVDEPMGDEVAPASRATAASPDSAQPDAPGPDPTAGSQLPPLGLREATTDDWLSGRQGPSADAYRRLRKLFPS